MYAKCMCARAFASVGKKLYVPVILNRLRSASSQMKIIIMSKYSLSLRYTSIPKPTCTMYMQC